MLKLSREAMLVSQTGPVGVELFSYANAFFCSNRFAYMLATGKHSIRQGDAENKAKKSCFCHVSHCFFGEFWISANQSA